MLLDDVEYVWRDGEDVLFDSTYLHSAHNRTDHPRLLLFCDVERPMRGQLSAAVNRFVIRHVVPLTQVANLPGDPVGAGNRLFAAMSPLRRGLRALKRDHVLAYRAVKVGAALAVVALLLLA